MSRVKHRHHLTHVDSCTTTATQALRVVLVYLSRRCHRHRWKGRVRSEVNCAQILYRPIPREPRVGLRDAGPVSLPSYPAQCHTTTRQRLSPLSLSQPRCRTAWYPRRTLIALQVAAPHGHRKPCRASSPACKWARSAQVHQVASTASLRRIRTTSTLACFRSRVL